MMKVYGIKFLLWIGIVCLSTSNGVWRDPKYANYSYVIEILPKVLMLPISKDFIKKAVENAAAAASFKLSDHSQDVYFYHWFTNHYNFTVVLQGDEALESSEVELFYLPTAGSAKELAQFDWWAKLDRDIQSFAQSRNNLNFVLDHTFMVATFPLQTRPIQFIHKRVRNVRDLRIFRSDNDMTPNGREIYVPYSIIRRKFQVIYPPNLKNHAYPDRKYLFFAVCREAKAAGEDVRRFRTVFYHHLTNSQLKTITSASIISQNLTSTEFNQALLESTFCFIIPGDTPSTSKLYKAIFSGCIPVIFVAFPTQLPFFSLIDWSKFSIIFYKDMIRFTDSGKKIDQLLLLLYKVSQNKEKLAQLRDNLRKVAGLFDYSKVDYPSVYHLSLIQLKLQVDADRKLVTPIETLNT